VTQLTQFKHWYYISDLDAFGPSKYIGYKDMNTSRYARGRHKTGVDTEKVLRQWFISERNPSTPCSRKRATYSFILDK
jgi:hypothetical protein